MEKNRFILRYAAGLYWLVDTAQAGIPYKAPLRMNEVGARIWELIDADKTESEIKKTLVDEYNAPYDIISRDVDLVISQIEKYVS